VCLDFTQGCTFQPLNTIGYNALNNKTEKNKRSRDQINLRILRCTNMNRAYTFKVPAQ